MATMRMLFIFITHLGTFIGYATSAIVFSSVFWGVDFRGLVSRRQAESSVNGRVIDQYGMIHAVMPVIASALDDDSPQIGIRKNRFSTSFLLPTSSLYRVPDSKFELRKLSILFVL